MSSNYVKNVAIVGAGGNSGRDMTKYLLETGKHTVTAITRADSTTEMPNGVQVKKVNYDDHQALVDALKGQDALIITLSVFAPHGHQEKLLKAAADANVPWVIPNEWSPDSAHEGLTTDVPHFDDMPRIRGLIKDLGKSSFIAVSCGFWYEWSLAIPAAFGIDSLKHEATLFDEGDTKITVTTWPQLGRAMAGLLSLPIKAEGSNKDHCLERFKNGHVYTASFTISQRDMLESVFRVTGTKESEWKITKEPSEKRYKDAIEAMKGGDRMGFVRAMYTRVFFPDDSGNHEKRMGTVNAMLGLPKEDLDEATKAAIERQKNSPW